MKEAIEKPSTGKEAYDLEKKYEKNEERLKDLDKKKHDTELELRSLKFSETMPERERESREKILNKQLEADKKSINSITEESKNIKGVLDEPETQQLLAKYVKELSGLLEPIGNESPEEIEKELSLWNGVKARIAIFFNENKIVLYELLGNKNAVADIRNTLDKLYSEFGRTGLLARARNSVKLAHAIDDVKQKIEKHLTALELYQKALQRGAINDAKKNSIVTEIENLSSELLQLGSALSGKEVAVSIRDTINQKIDAALKSFGIAPSLRQELERKANIVVPEINKEMLIQQRDAIKSQTDDVYDRIKKDPIKAFSDPVVTTFFENLANVEKINLSQLSAEELGAQKEIIKNAYTTVADGVLNTLIANPGLNLEARITLLSRLIEFTRKGIEQEKDINNIFVQYVDRHGRNPRPTELGDEKPLPENITLNAVKKQLDVLMQNVTNNLGKPAALIDSYTKLNKAVNEYSAMLDNAQVSQNSLAIRAWILENVYGKLNSVFTKSRTNSPLLGQFFVDTVINLGTMGQKLERDQSVLIKEKEKKGNVSVLEVVKASAHPADEEKNDEKKSAVTVDKNNKPQGFLGDLLNARDRLEQRGRNLEGLKKSLENLEKENAQKENPEQSAFLQAMQEAVAARTKQFAEQEEKFGVTQEESSDWD